MTLLRELSGGFWLSSRPPRFSSGGGINGDGGSLAGDKAGLEASAQMLLGGVKVRAPSRREETSSGRRRAGPFLEKPGRMEKKLQKK